MDLVRDSAEQSVQFQPADSGLLVVGDYLEGPRINIVNTNLNETALLQANTEVFAAPTIEQQAEGNAGVENQD